MQKKPLNGAILGEFSEQHEHQSIENIIKSNARLALFNANKVQI